jgi:hypothetical protein
MTTRARGPFTLKGALVSVPDGASSPTVIAFQYNPSTLKRSLQAELVGGETDDRSLAVRFKGAPVETITAEIEIDGTDLLEQGDPTTLESGILPQLAALELLIYPTTTQVANAQAQLANGTLEIVPMAAPRTLFVWGAKRVVPIKLQSWSITEEAFDSHLNPIRATLSLTMRVLTYSDLDASTKDYHQFMVYQQALETMAPSAVSSAPLTDTGVDPSSF